ncbi:MAG: hypothetical protein JST16_06745 [Bdellovibrionales bacterium]|nr:hypothetical protein [Bdellovibrionales bacterium]
MFSRKVLGASFLLSLLALSLPACSSKPSGKEGPKRVDMNHTEWDYDKIRQARDAEKVQTPSPSKNSDDEADCIVMTRSQMIRSNSGGCRKMDAREGRGKDAYCCPKE